MLLEANIIAVVKKLSFGEIFPFLRFVFNKKLYVFCLFIVGMGFVWSCCCVCEHNDLMFCDTPIIRYFI